MRHRCPAWPILFFGTIIKDVRDAKWSCSSPAPHYDGYSDDNSADRCPAIWLDTKEHGHPPFCISYKICSLWQKVKCIVLRAIWYNENVSIRYFYNNNMKKLCSLIAVFALIVLPVFCHAAEIKTGEDFSLRRGQTISDDLYAGSASVVIAGDVTGDLVGGGGSILVSGVIGQDVMLAGGTIHLSGMVRDDVRIAGGTIFVEGSVDDDLFAAGGQINLVSGSLIGGNLVAAGGMIIMDSSIGGDAYLAGGQVVIKGTVRGNVQIYADKILIEKTAIIAGNLSYRSPGEAQIASGAQIKGEVDFQKAGKSRSPILSPSRGIGLGILAGLWGVVHVTKFITLLVFALLFMLAFGRIAENITERSVKHFWKNLGLGFLVLIMSPITAIIAFVTIIGLPFGFILMLGYIAWLIVAWVITPVIVGSIVYRLVTKRVEVVVNWKTVIIGCVTVFVLGLIPIVGWVLKFAFMLVAMGSLLKMKYEYFIAHR